MNDLCVCFMHQGQAYFLMLVPEIHGGKLGFGTDALTMYPQMQEIVNDDEYVEIIEANGALIHAYASEYLSRQK